MSDLCSSLLLKTLTNNKLIIGIPSTYQFTLFSPGATILDQHSLSYTQTFHNTLLIEPLDSIDFSVFLTSWFTPKSMFISLLIVYDIKGQDSFTLVPFQISVSYIKSLFHINGAVHQLSNNLSLSNLLCSSLGVCSKSWPLTITWKPSFPTLLWIIFITWVITQYYFICCLNCYNYGHWALMFLFDISPSIFVCVCVCTHVHANTHFLTFWH